MANSIVGGLFGIDPAQYQQQKDAIANQQALQFAEMDPFQRANYGMFRGGQQLGQAASGLMGAQDPQLQAASIAQKLAGQFDTTTAEGLKQYAAALQKTGADTGNVSLSNLSMIALDKANALSKASLENLKTQSEIVKNQREGIKQVGLSSDGRQVYQSGNEQYILGPGGERIPYYGTFESRQTKNVTSVNLGGLAQLFAKTQVQADAKQVSEDIAKAQSALSTNSKVSRDIDQIEKLLPNTFTGKFANFSKDTSKTLSALGIPVSEKASNTEVLQALTNNLVLPAVKQLPGSLAAKELAFLQETKPSSLQEPATIKRLVGLLKDDIAVNRALVKKADEYQKNDKYESLKGFNIALVQDDLYGKVRTLNNLKAKVANKQGITQDEAEMAKNIEKELGL